MSNGERDASAENPNEAKFPPFDWRLGLALAGCAFEAYNELEESSGECLKQLSTTGTELAYVDADFLNAHMAGLLKITDISAVGLRNADTFTSSDPYVQLSVGMSSARTKTMPNTLDAQWNETFFLFVTELSTQRLCVRVMDEDVATSDDPLGFADFSLQALQEGCTQELEASLVSGKGTISLQATYLPFNGSSSLADLASSAEMGGPVIGSPPYDLIHSKWRGLKALLIPAEAVADAMFDPLCFFNNPDSHTQAWVFWKRDRRKLVVAFRGTEATVLKDLLTDLNLVPTRIDRKSLDEADAAMSLVPTKGYDTVVAASKAFVQGATSLAFMRANSGLTVATRKDNQKQMVHSGFLYAYLSIRQELVNLLDTILAAQAEPGDWTVYLCGHSLGGALSTLCAYDLSTRDSEQWPNKRGPNLVNYSYGSPRVGNHTFAGVFNLAMPNTWRVVNNTDAVASIPKLFGYCHVGHKVLVTPEGKVEVESSSVKNISEGIEATEVATALLRSLKGRKEHDDSAGVYTQEELQALIKAETASISGIINGEGVKDHSEDKYLANLQAAIEEFFQEQDVKMYQYTSNKSVLR